MLWDKAKTPIWIHWLYIVDYAHIHINRIASFYLKMKVSYLVSTPATASLFHTRSQVLCGRVY